MKKLLLIAALAAAPALADTWAMPNKGGGEIVLTERSCPNGKGLLRVYGYLADGKAIFGCWTVLDGMVHVVWDDGSRYTYPIENFYTKTKDKKGSQL